MDATRDGVSVSASSAGAQPTTASTMSAAGSGRVTSNSHAEATPGQLYAAPAQQPAAGGRIEYEAYAALGRRMIGNFSDRARQAVMDVISGTNGAATALAMTPDPVLESVNAELWQRRDEYSTKREVSILTGTFNVNAKSPDESLLPWVLPDTLPNDPDIIALAFQEVVPLTPSQILLTDPSRLWVWENAIMEAINRRAQKQGEYAFVRSEQLVGTALLILVKTSLLHNVRQIESATKKTGLRGMSGNKGGVAIRLKVFDSTVCFVTAHLAAGQSNVDQRNDDYRTISSGLVFSQGTSISSHDHIFWFGDFNYRIDIANERARYYAEMDDYSALMAKDQLKRAQEAQLVFVGFNEGQIGFRPTYKYDNGTSTYDSSEKQRVPAWTDRILFRGLGLRQLIYNRAELVTSDHRPVYAFFEAELRIHDQKRRKEVLGEIMSKRRAVVGRVAGAGMELSSSESDEEELPEPSSDTFSWWDQTGPDSDSDTSSNSEEDRPSNPFRATPRTDGAPPTAQQFSTTNGLSTTYATTTTNNSSSGSAPKRLALPPLLPSRDSRATTPDSASAPTSSTTGPQHHQQQQLSPPAAQRRAPPPIPQKPSLSSLGMPSSSPAAAGTGSGNAVLQRPGTGGAGVGPSPPRRPGFVRSKSVASTRSLLTDSE
ncbi:unnamed protein product [Tilletia laevis]|uniref:phosphoinositide 5-phosphatase n=3 Tax=Tilletia TaxID=13289 RepID=A0A9N8LI40_9BASI|nr:hypothetical protein CF328_g492 [Tilletia controversa]KAE8207193.1 hypothetical protein CF335_g1317 [Tilletia laevis]KAE8263650.1 hypothetical protein A4X03_0g1524 [Tilletia caries]CAD6914913.1 unnamed protein product [Tilletia laevis]CAD7063856.1 unnamed protein product [Tilletia caries]